MKESCDIAIRVISREGTCTCGHKAGDEWIIRDYKSPEGICLYALNAIMPFVWTLAFGGTLPWEKDPDAAVAVCPDGDNPVTFEIRRSGDLQKQP